MIEHLQKVARKLGVMEDFIRFLWERKLWWLIPMFLILFLLGFVIVATQGTAIAPFIYTLF